MLVDSHCHLDFPALTADRPEVLARARAADVHVMQTIGTRLSTFRDVLAIAEQEPGVFCSIGVHPHNADEEGLDDPSPLLEWTTHERVIGVGEAGLDRHYDHGSPAAQQANFWAHIEAARQSGLPLVVHTRDADDATIETLQKAMAEGPFRGVIHCYSSSATLAHAALELGLYLGIGGIITFKRSEELRSTVRELPVDRLLLETDAPYLAPEPLRGRRNEPAHVAQVAVRLAELKSLPVADIARITTENFFCLFDKARPPVR